MITKMMVQNLSSRMTEDSLSRLFSDYGAVKSVCLATDIMTGRCGGFGFVHLDEQQPGAALNALNGRCVHNRALLVTFEQKRYHGSPATKGSKSDRQAMLLAEKIANA
jgi:RNA recognition motif-containing protein